MKRHSLTFFASLLALLIGVQSGASVFLPFDLTSQVRDSDIVFEGKVEIVFSCPDPNVNVPRTCASVAVERFIKGSRAASHLTLVVPGGEADNGTYVQMVGAPIFREGETILASTFLTPDPTGLVGLVNFDTALLRKSESKGGGSVAMNAHERVLEALPLRDRAVFYDPDRQPAGSSGAEEPLSWNAARQALEAAAAIVK